VPLPLRLPCLAAAAALSFACASLTDPTPAELVQPYGADQFVVSYNQSWSPAAARRTALADATRFCGVRNELMVPDVQDSTPTPDRSFQLIFHCTPEPVKQ